MEKKRPSDLPRRRKKKKGTGLLHTPVVPLAALAVVLFVLILLLEGAAASGETEPMNTEPPTDPPAGKVATATIGATGDVLLHDRVIRGGLDSDTGEYNYDNIFTYFAEYVEDMDYAVANMEGTLCSDSNGYPYAGYPCFNAPDAIVDSLKAAGFDMLLTANNHSYDTGFTGLTRTQQVISDRGLAHIGTRPDAGAENYLVTDVGGIRVGMSCYTYETGGKSLNGIRLSQEAAQLVNTFDYQDLDSFYGDLSGEISAMKAAGAECIVLFIHWGDEYNTTPNAAQKSMAQALCDLGVDVIVGGHAHVVQPIEMLTGTTDPEHATLCLYSMGNAVSNIRIEDGFGAYTEDGMLFTFTLSKYTDGTVLVESAGVLPTWVNRYTSDETGREVFAIIPLDETVEDWQRAFGLTDTALAEAEQSLRRTQGVISESLDSANQVLAQRQGALEAALGIQ